MSGWRASDDQNCAVTLLVLGTDVLDVEGHNVEMEFGEMKKRQAW